MISMTMALTRITLRTKVWRLNLSSGSMYFFSLGCNVWIVARIYWINQEIGNHYFWPRQWYHSSRCTSFQTTLSSSKICGLLPLALARNLRSLRAYHLFWPLATRNKGITTAPRNSNLWSLSSSYTVTCKTELMSFTLLKSFATLILVKSKHSIKQKQSTTYKVNILFHEGFKVLYSVCVCNLELTSWSTQNGSDLPPISADANPVARKTFTLRCPTSLRLWSVFHRLCRMTLQHWICNHGKK